jgi:DNA primase
MRSFLIAKHNFTLQDLAKAGLIYVRDRKGYDRFRGRVIFPLHDNRGNVLGFSGRILPNDKSENLAKYINSPETSVYHKSANLFGLHLVKKEVKNKDEAIVVEGELDMISSWQIGIKNIVAIKGSAFTQDQVKLLRRYARKVVLALDADIAGDAAARRGIMIAQAEGMDIAVTNLGKYKDPDDAARSDPQFLKKALENATDIWDFLVNSLFSKYDVNTSQDRNKISREVVPILLSIEDDIVQAHYVTKVAKKLNVPVDAVIKAVSKAGTSLTNIDNSYSMQADIKKEDRQAILEKRLIALSFLTDPVYLLDDKVNTFFTTTFAKRILEELVNYYRKADKKNFSIAEFTKKLPRELVDGFSSLFIKESSDLPSVDDKIVNKERDLVIKELEILKVKGELARLGNNVLAAEKKGKSKDILTANRAFSEQTQKLANLENE